jgi:hypothetical protein
MLRADKWLAEVKRRSGWAGYGLLTVAAPVSAGDWLSIATRQYDCVVGENPGNPAEGLPRPVWVPEAADPVPAADFLTALERKINRDLLCMAKARRLSATKLLCTARGLTPATVITTSASFTAAGNGWAGSSFTWQRGKATFPVLPAGTARVVLDWEATEGLVVFPLWRRPRGFLVQVRGTDGGLVPFDGTALREGRNVVVRATGSVALVAGMTVTLLIF